MSWKVHETDEVFAALRGLCSNVYRMYDPCEYRYYYDHDCDAYECVVEEAAEEYERLLKHCEKQREELAAIKNPLGRLKEEFMGNVDTEIERIEGSSKVRAGSSITDELREWARNHTVNCSDNRIALVAIAERIDERHEKELERMWDEAEGADPDGFLYGDYVKLPVDADGVPIRVGDELTDGENLPSAVCCMLLRDGGWTVSSKALFGFGIRPSTLRHVKPDSWERIIADAVKNGMYDHDNERIQQKLVERCKRLAGEGA